MSEQSEYFIQYEKISVWGVLKAIFKSWFFTWRALWNINSLIYIFYALFILAWLFMQILLFFPGLPLILFLYWPLGVLMSRKPESSWLQWALLYALSTFAFSVLSGFFGAASLAAILATMVVQAFGVGAFTYKNLYTKRYAVAGRNEQLEERDLVP